MLVKKIILTLVIAFAHNNWASEFSPIPSKRDNGVLKPLFPYTPPTGILKKKFNHLLDAVNTNKNSEGIQKVFDSCTTPEEKILLMGCFAFIEIPIMSRDNSSTLNAIRRDLLPTAKALLDTPGIQLKLKEESDMRALNTMLSDDFDSPDNLFYLPAPDFPAPDFREGE